MRVTGLRAAIWSALVVAYATAAESQSLAAAPEIRVTCDDNCQTLTLTTGEAPDAQRGDARSSVLVATPEGEWRVADAQTPAPNAPSTASGAGADPRVSAAPRSRALSTTTTIGIVMAGFSALPLALAVHQLALRNEVATTFNDTGCQLQYGAAAYVPGASCASYLHQVERYDEAMTIATVVGGTLLAGGVTMIVMGLLAPRSQHAAAPPRWWIGAGPSPVGLGAGAYF